MTTDRRREGFLTEINEYAAFAEFYDRLTADVDYPARADYFLKLFDRCGVTPGSLLDLACGSGTLSLELSARGADVIGVDGSEDMLALAQDKARRAGRSLLFLHQDMRRLDLYGTVDGAVCTLDSLNHLLDTGSLAEIFRRLHLFIAPGGVLLFDVNTPYKHRHILGDNSFVYEEEDFLCVWRNHLIERTCEVEMLLDFFIETPDGRYERLTDRVRERAYSRRTWEQLLEAAGFERLGVFGDGGFDPPVEAEERWVFAARRK